MLFKESGDVNVIIHNGLKQNIKCEILEDRDHVLLIYAYTAQNKIYDQKQIHKHITEFN